MARRIERRNSPIHGSGVFALEDIPSGVKVARYKGTLRTHKQADKLYSGDSETGHTFLFTLNDHYVIDANKDGNKARWINHSCSPNCQALLVEAEGNDRSADKVIIESLRPIKAGEELTYNYGITLEEPHTARMKKIWACRCGAKECTGTMLQPKRKPKAKAS